MDRYKKVVSESLEIARAGQAGEAFDLLDNAINEAIEENRHLWALILSKHGAVIANVVHDHPREIQYSEQALRFTTTDYPFAAYNLAQLLLQDGQRARAEQLASEAYKLAATGTTQADSDLIAAIRNQWPNLDQND